MINILVLVGLPGSGKTTVAKNILETSGIYSKIISSDSIREELFGDENVQADNALVFKIYHDRLADAITKGESVILDATNVTIKVRKHVFETVQRVKKLVSDQIHVKALVVNTPIETVIKQDVERKRVVGADVIYKYIYSYQHPQKYEGFEEVCLLYNSTGFNEKKLDELKMQMLDFDQNNPHHIYCLFIHCLFVACHLVYDDIMYQAGMLHDVGKLFTRTNDENGVSHFKGHDSYGTYYLVSNPDLLNYKTNDELNEILFYINFHMRAHRDFKGRKAIQKHRNLFGNERYEKLMQFGEYDRIASGTYDGGE